MLKFDKMKIISRIEDISNIDESVFISNIQGDNLLYYKYHQSKPFQLLIMVNYTNQELVLEFTGKILLNNYKDLINMNTIRQCLDEINRIGICTLNVDGIVLYSYVAKCDVTKDVEVGSFSTLFSQIRQTLSNYRQWICRSYANGVVVENTVKTPRYKKRLVIYEKEHELQKATNVDFLNVVTNRDELLGSFKNTIRFELNINTMSQIRSMLRIENTSLMAVLLSAANPILDVVNQAIKEFVPSCKPCGRLKDYERSLLLKECGYDLVAVEAKIRELISKNTSLKNVMLPYIELYQQIQNTSDVRVDIRELVA